MFASLSGAHGSWVNCGDDWLSHIAMPNQNAGCSWKLKVPPVPSCFGSVGGSLGSGNNATYLLRLPKDPPTLPKQDGTGGTFNFQLHPAFWFGMALCDNQSAPEFTHAACAPDSDTNIFDG